MRKITLVTTGGRSASSAFASAVTGKDVIGFHDVHMMPFFYNGAFDGGPMVFDSGRFKDFIGDDERSIVICGPIITVIPLSSWVACMKKLFECEVNTMMLDCDNLVESINRSFPGDPNVMEAALLARKKALDSMSSLTRDDGSKVYPNVINMKKLIDDINTDEQYTDDGIACLYNIGYDVGIRDHIDMYNFVTSMCYYKVNINPGFFRNFRHPGGKYRVHEMAVGMQARGSSSLI